MTMRPMRVVEEKSILREWYSLILDHVLQVVVNVRVTAATTVLECQCIRGFR